MNPITFTIRRDDALAMQFMASKDESRSVINGIHFECINGCLMLISTNGRTLGALNVGKIDATEDFSFVANVNRLRFLKANKERPKVSVAIHEKEVWFSNKSGKIACDKIEGMYPNWRMVVPSAPYIPHAPVLSVDYLCEFREVAKLLNGQPEITHRMHMENDAISVFLNDQRFYGVMMPVRSDRTFEIPEWIKPAPANTQAMKAAA